MKKRIRSLLNTIFVRPKVKKMCFLSSMLGYKYTTDWIIDNIPEAAYIIGEYLNRHPEAKEEMINTYFKDPDYIFNKTLNKYRQMKFIEENGLEIEELKMFE